MASSKQYYTVEPRSTDTRLIRTPGYCGQFRLSRRGKAYTFSLKLTRLIRTPVNTDTLVYPLGVRINRVPLYYYFYLFRTQTSCLSDLFKQLSVLFCTSSRFSFYNFKPIIPQKTAFRFHHFLSFLTDVSWCHRSIPGFQDTTNNENHIPLYST